MATTIYFRDAAADISRGQGDADLVGTTRQWSPKAMATARGAAGTSQIRSAVAGPTAGIEAGTTVEWISPPIDQDVTISGSVSFNLWATESAMTNNTGVGCIIQRLDSTGAIASTIVNNPEIGVELDTSASVRTEASTPTSTNMLKGDRFRIRVYFDDAVGQTMTVSGTLSFSYDGPTASVNGDSFVTFTETFGFQTGGGVGSAVITQASGTAKEALNGGSGSGEKVAQGFTLGSTTTIAAVDLNLAKSGTPTDNVVLDVVSTLDGSSLATASVAASGLAAAAADFRFTFSSPPTLAAGSYYLQLSRSGARDVSNHPDWAGTLSDVYAGGASTTKQSGVWGLSVNVNDLRFIIYEAVATGSTLYLTDTASAVSTASVDREAWTSRGAGVQTDATNDATGPTAPIQVSDTLGGTVVDWFTKPLTAFTLDGLILCNIRALETNAGSNAAVRCEIAVTAGDGTGATVWGAATDNAELGTSEAAQTFYVAGAATSVTSGQRLRIRLSFDDAPGVAMANAGDLTLYYAGTTAAASGDTYITLPQTVTEATSGTTVSVTPGAVTFAGQSVLLKTTIAVTPGAVAVAGQTVNTSVATMVGVTPAAVTVTGQSVALKNTVTVTAGAVALTGQTVNTLLTTAVPVTSGAVTITGQTVNLVRSIPATPGAVTLAGQTVTPTSIIPVTPGAVTFAGQTVTPGTTSGGTTVSVTPAAVTLTGQTVNTTLTTTVPVTPAAVTLTGQTILLRSLQVVTVGAVTITGQSVLLRTNLVVTPAAVTITGQTVNLATAIVVAVTPAAVTISGQTVTPTQAQPVVAGAVTLAGQTVALKNTVAATPGAITLTGQTVNIVLGTVVPVTPGAVSLTGQAVNLKITVAVAPGAVSITGQPVGLTGAVNVTATPGAVILTGQTVLLRTNLVVTPGAVTLQGQTVNTGGVVSVPVTTPGAVTFAGQTVNIVLVIVVPVTPAAVTLVGQTILLRSSQSVTAGAVTFAGQTVNLLAAIVVPVTPAAVVLTGQTVNLKNTVTATPGVVTLQGQTVNTGAVTTVSVTPAAVTLSGQTVLLRGSQALTAGQITVSGQAVGVVRSVPVTPGALSLAGQTVALRTLAALQPGTITLTGLDVHLGIPEEYTIALQAVWRPRLVFGGQHAPTVANRGAHRPTLVRAGVHLPTLTKAGANSP